jgi:hypothetical protein
MHGQSRRAVELLWDPICVATLNAAAREVSYSSARKVFLEGFLRRDGANLVTFLVPLGEIFDAVRRHVESRGGSIRESSGVRRILVSRGIVRGVELVTGETIAARAVVCAVPPSQLRPLVAGVPELEPLTVDASRLRWSPIVNLHLWFDRPVLETAFAVAVDSPVQAVFDVTPRDGEHGRSPRSHIVISQSAAGEWMAPPPDRVAALLREALGALIPAVRRAICRRHLVLRSPRATFVPEPGTEHLRPAPTTAVDGLLLAGDWVSTGWPSTIESAVLSGLRAARSASQLATLSSAR